MADEELQNIAKSFESLALEAAYLSRYKKISTVIYFLRIAVDLMGAKKIEKEIRESLSVQSHIKGN